MAGQTFGFHAVEALLGRGVSVQRVLLQAGRKDRRIQALADRARAAGVPVEEVPKRALDRRCGGARHQGVLAEHADADTDGLPVADLAGVLAQAGESALLLVLDQVTDPRNLGACLRSAAAAGAHAVVTTERRSAALTPAARKVASGGAEALPLVSVPNLAQALQRMQEAGLWVVGTTGDAPQDIHSVDLSGPVALVLGAEDTGLRRLTREHCDLLARIPMTDAVESLNVSVAAGVCLFEARRQRAGA